METGNTENSMFVRTGDDTIGLQNSEDFDFITTTTSSTFTIENTSEIEIVSFDFKETSDGNFIEVIKRQMPNPNFTLTLYPPREPVARIWKEIYGVSTGADGNRTLNLIKVIVGDVTPGHYVEEGVSFDE